ncbi:HD domain-containing protein [Terrilactibacillus sp. BCM23-1]|uniref:HD domain-containing protein n=1 Tax=Terrilactibacillus tamarindi TaxID=2599694 RepID=A0A6N8CL75_9BACI|nr:HD domain-containing protein [Terrilactibacillus tamarindi]MTT30471.1 HD domain-containing protein [Terrilactibacillus tamarindi]
MSTKDIIKEAELYVKNELKKDHTGHDWWHIDRVRNMAMRIAEEEQANLFICEMASLLHDIADEKLNASESEGIQKVSHWLIEHHVDEKTKKHIMMIITQMSFKGGNRPPMTSIEGKVVQDADRLDAMGAIGIARALTFGGAKSRVLYDPSIQPRYELNERNYRSNDQTTLNHFYEKLFKLKDRMNTRLGKKMAIKRHERLERFVHEFLEEWEGLS